MSDTASLWQPPALRIVNPVADKLTFEQELEHARQQGYQEGLRQGQEEGRRQARNMIAEMSALWDAMQEPFADMEHDVHETLMGLSVAMAEAVLQRELETDQTLIRKSLDAGLTALGTVRHSLDVELNPRDADLVSALLEEEGLENRIKTNPNLMPGGCKLRAGSALVDTTVESMVRASLESITERARLTDEAGNDTAKALSADEIAAIAKRFSGALDDE